MDALLSLKYNNAVSRHDYYSENSKVDTNALREAWNLLNKVLHQRCQYHIFCANTIYGVLLDTFKLDRQKLCNNKAFPALSWSVLYQAYIIVIYYTQRYRVQHFLLIHSTHYFVPLELYFDFFVYLLSNENRKDYSPIRFRKLIPFFVQHLFIIHSLLCTRSL